MGTDVATTHKYEIANPDEIAEIWAEELDGFTPEFDRIKVPGAGGLAWEVPTEDPDNPDTVKELVGVIVDHHASSRLYLTEFDGSGGGRPDAWSDDGKTQIVPDETIEYCRANGMPIPSTDLDACPYNQFGSASLVGGKGEGKASRNYHEIYLLMEGDVLPKQLSIPATSVKNFKSWMMKRVIGAGLRPSGVITKITLKKAESKGGITYSQVQFQTVDRLDKATADALKSYGEGLKTVTRKQRSFVAKDDAQTGAPNNAPVAVQTTQVADDDLPI